MTRVHGNRFGDMLQMSSDSLGRPDNRLVRGTVVAGTIADIEPLPCYPIHDNLGRR